MPKMEIFIDGDIISLQLRINAWLQEKNIYVISTAFQIVVRDMPQIYYFIIIYEDKKRV